MLEYELITKKLYHIRNSYKKYTPIKFIVRKDSIVLELKPYIVAVLINMLLISGSEQFVIFPRLWIKVTVEAGIIHQIEKLFLSTAVV